MQRFFCFLNAMAQPAAEMRRAVYLRDCCMYVFVRMRFQFGSENCFSRAMRGILPVRFSLFSGEKARKMRERHTFR